MDLTTCPWQVTFERVKRWASWRWYYRITDGETVIKTSEPKFRHRSEAEAAAWGWMERTAADWEGAESETISITRLAERMGAAPQVVRETK